MEIALLKHTFLASDTAAALPPTDATRQALDLLVTHLVEQAGRHPLHLGPRTVLATLGLPTLTSVHTDNPDIGQVLRMSPRHGFSGPRSNAASPATQPTASNKPHTRHAEHSTPARSRAASPDPGRSQLQLRIKLTV
ncbi:hypothetical protein [Micromonospora sp. KC213]|uniref:hypothetical protein n=1 Tax=Micromonospora sp. KC213 TaxID=2530378 RepID=UPI00104846C7|nr:hypothetical protein [Micromonospora sp. KC213]TDC35143.1 hypothetical protein E1166_23920 [Micromonospora sp. KC213]